jgi:Papain family cysteine protease
MPVPRRPRATAAGTPRLLNVAESPPDVWDAIERRRLRDVDPPRALDLRKNRPWYRIGDQEHTGSCIGWALADSVMRWKLVNEGRLAQRERLSPRFVWMASKEWQAQRRGREHATVADLLTGWQPSTFMEEATTVAKDALQVARHLGVVTEPMLKWKGPLNRGPEAEFWERAKEFKLEAYYSVTAAGLEDRLRRWRQWISQHGPLMIVVATDKSFLDGEQVLREFQPRERVGLHACALVGFTRDDHFIVRNSWGTDWGDKGYANATPEWLSPAVRECYGVLFPERP